jgi:hypothetical protein
MVILFEIVKINITQQPRRKSCVHQKVQAVAAATKTREKTVQANKAALRKVVSAVAAIRPAKDLTNKMKIANDKEVVGISQWGIDKISPAKAIMPKINSLLILGIVVASHFSSFKTL